MSHLNHISSILPSPVTCRNAQILLWKLERLTNSEHKDIFELVKDMMLTDFSNLLPRYRHLLECNYKELGGGTTVAWKLWLKPQATIDAVSGKCGRSGATRQQW